MAFAKKMMKNIILLGIVPLFIACNKTEPSVNDNLQVEDNLRVEVKSELSQKESERLSFVAIPEISESWPYKYELTRECDIWSGKVYYRDSANWILLDKLSEVELEGDSLHFKAPIDVQSKTSMSDWQIRMASHKTRGLEALLTGSMFDSRAIKLNLKPL